MTQRKPIALHAVQGTLRRDRHAGRGAAALGALKPPDGLTAEQAQVWRELAAIAPRGVLKAADSAVFLELVFAVTTHRQAIRAHAAEGCPLLAETPNRFQIPHPLLAVVNKQAGLIRQFAGELGFSPTARAGLLADPSTVDLGDWQHGLTG